MQLIYNEIDWSAYQPENADHYADPLPTTHVAFLITSNHNNNKNHHNNCSGDKQSNGPNAHSSGGYSTQKNLSPLTQW